MRPCLLFLSGSDRAEDWSRAIKALMPDLEIRVWPDCGDPGDITYALPWKPPSGALKPFKNLKAILSLGAGVDGLIGTDLPPGVPILRMVDAQLTRGMVEYALYWVLHFHRAMPAYAQAQTQGVWRGGLAIPDTPQTVVGVMGLGEIGGAVARAFASIGFATRGYSTRPRAVGGVEVFAGEAQLPAFLAGCRFLVCVLPLTPATRGILGAKTFALLPEGAVVINIARGGHLDDQALIAALNAGRIGHAVLDVFHGEPLAPDHPFWRHPKVTITPHVASVTLPRTGAAHVVECIRRAEAGLPIGPLVDLSRGY
jgi:glyoxylate/hydroxypyruvate reductase A